MSISLVETIDISINQLFKNTNTAESVTNSELKQQLPCLATKDALFYI